MQATSGYLNKRRRSYREVLIERMTTAAQYGARDHKAEKELARITRRRLGVPRRIAASS